MLDTKKQSSLLNYIKAFILATISSFAICVTNGTHPIKDSIRDEVSGTVALVLWQIRSSFPKPDYMTFLFVILAFIAYAYLIPRVNKKNIKWGVPFSLVASLFLLLCDSYYTTSSWDKLFESTTAIFTSGLKGLGIATIVFFIFDLINRVSIEKIEYKANGSYKKKFLILTAIMFACWIPYMIILAPGCMGADTRDQLGQILNNEDLCWSAKIVVWNEGDLLLNNHHPVFFTLLLGVFVKFGELIGSYFVGMELYCIVQCIAFTATLTYSVLKMKELGLSKNLARIIYVFFVLCPIFPLWGMSTFKDTPFTIALLLVIILLYDAFKFPEKFKGKKYFALFLVLLLLMLVRNNGFYMLLVLLPFVIIHFRKDKKFLVKIVSVLLIPMLLFKVGYTEILFNAVGIHEGSPREMLSVPFQQTARYILEYKDEITPEEEENILAVLGSGDTTLDDIADSYMPDRSDPVKSLYNKYATNSDLINYFKTWAVELKKHPAVYVEAFLNLNYSWFNFESRHDFVYYDGIIDENIPKYVSGLENPESLTDAKDALWQFVHLIAQVPLVSATLELSFYTWAYVVVFLAMLMRKKHKELLAILPIFANYLICFVGPVAYMRYVVPMVACLPFTIFITFSRDKNKSEEIKDIGDSEIWIK